MNDFEMVEKRIVNLKQKVLDYQRLKEKSRNPSTIQRFKRLENMARTELAELEKVDKPTFWIDKESAENLNYKVANQYQKFKAKNIRLSVKGDTSRSKHVLVRASDLALGYADKLLFEGVNIDLREGEAVELRGRNGAGKSTLMKMIAGLVEPSEGSIELFANFVPQTERYRIGCVIESPALYAELTAKQNLEVFRKAYGLSSKESVQQILKQVGLSQYENKIVKKFSLGMKQRLAIGVALLGNPDFLILDEPINGLDPTGIQDMRNFLLKLNREEHITIMISSHILGELSKIATKYGIIKNGKLIEEITAKELNEKCQCCLKIKASDTAQAAILIEKNLHTKNYEILSDNNIRIFEYVDNPGIVNSLLVNHGISVDECTVTKESLEDYFNEKMRGGIVNA